MVGAYILGSTLRSWKSNMSTIDESPVFEMPPAKKPTVRLSCYDHNTCTHTHPGDSTGRDARDGKGRQPRQRPKSNRDERGHGHPFGIPGMHVSPKSCSAVFSIFSW